MANNSAFYVPEVIEELTTKHILTTELVTGVALDKLEHLDQETKNKVRLNSPLRLRSRVHQVHVVAGG